MYSPFIERLSLVNMFFKFYIQNSFDQWRAQLFTIRELAELYFVFFDSQFNTNLYNVLVGGTKCILGVDFV